VLRPFAAWYTQRINNAASQLGKLSAAKRKKQLGKKGMSEHMRMKFRFEAGATDPKDFVFFVLPLAMVIKHGVPGASRWRG
jgi:hypothetical protein